MPGKLGKDPRFYPVVRIGAAIEVLRVKRLAARMRDEVVVEPLEVFRRDLAVAAPPDRMLGQRINDRVLVLGGSAGMDTRFRAQRTALHEGGFAARDRVLVEQRRGVVPVDRLEVLEAKSIGAARAVPQTRFLHERPPRRSRLPPDLLPVAYISIDDSARRTIPRPINDEQGLSNAAAQHHGSHSAQSNGASHLHSTHKGRRPYAARRASSTIWLSIWRRTFGAPTRCGNGRRNAVRSNCSSRPSGSQPAQRHCPSGAPRSVVAKRRTASAWSRFMCATISGSAAMSSAASPVSVKTSCGLRSTIRPNPATRCAPLSVIW